MRGEASPNVSEANISLVAERVRREAESVRRDEESGERMVGCARCPPRCSWGRSIATENVFDTLCFLYGRLPPVGYALTAVGPFFELNIVDWPVICR